MQQNNCKIITLPTAYRNTQINFTQEDFITALFHFLFKLDIVKDEGYYGEFVLEHEYEVNNILDFIPRSSEKAGGRKCL